MIDIEVVYGKPNNPHVISLQIPENSAIKDAIAQSGILEMFPEINLTQHSVGIFSQKATLETILKPGDRIEIYCPLAFDPKQARLQRIKRRTSSRSD